MSNSSNYDMCDVAIIGSGPAGIAAATALKENGVDSVIVLERETEAGGIPRHCGHPPFGVSEYRRVLTGPSYAKKNVSIAINSGVEILVQTTVTSLGKDGLLEINSPKGVSKLKAKRVVIATGTRETPRSARMISGQRPLGICTTGTLQSMVYLKNRIPFKCPVIVGTEIVSFSSLLTCRKAGIKPVAMLEEGARPKVMWPINYASNLAGVPLLKGTRITDIGGRERVEYVKVSDCKGNEKEIACDGVLFTGLFTPESSLVRLSHLTIDEVSGEPIVDKYNRCSDPIYYAVGNVIFKPVKVAGKCWREGRNLAHCLLNDLNGARTQ